jgi:hypothetical protein
MTVANEKKTSRHVERQPQQWTLAGIGVAEPWEVSLNCNRQNSDDCFLQIESPGIQLCVPADSAEVVEQLLSFLEAASANGQALPAFCIGSESSTTMTLSRDDECKDRYFLWIRAVGGFSAHFTIAGNHLELLRQALLALREDLTAE